MAELLGVSAASLQIGEVLVKLVGSCTKLAKQLKDAPQEVRKMLRSMYDFQYLCHSCRGLFENHAAEVNAVIRPTDVNQIRAWLDHAYQILQSLEKLLSTIEPQSNDNRRDKFLKAVTTVMEQGGLAANLQELDRIRANIDSFFIRHNLRLTVVQSVKIEEHWHQDHGLLIDTRSIVTETNESQKSILQDLAGMGARIEASISTAQQANLAAFDCRLQEIKDYIDRGLAVAKRSSSDTGISQEVIEFTKTQLHGLDMRAVTSISSYPSPPMLCPCQRIGRVERLCNIGPVTLIRLTYGIHYPGCQYYGQGNEERAVRQLSVELSPNYEHRSSSLLRDAVARASSLVGNLVLPRIISEQEENAPGFKHISSAAFKIKTILGLHDHDHVALPECKKRTQGQILQCRGTLKCLYDDLLRDFNVSSEWERVQTVDGKTLLHAFVYILWDLFTMQKELSEDVAKILSLLIKGGTCVNTTMVDHHSYRNGTALSVFMTRIYITNVISAGRMEFLRLLSYHDIPSFSHGPRKLESHVGVRLFIAVPELAIEYGCSRLALAVITRNESEVKNLLDLHRRGQLKGDINVSPDGLSPLCFAVGWPAGIKMLLKERADPSEAIRIAIIYQEVDSLELLLKSDNYFLFRPRDYQNTKTQKLWQSPLIIYSLLDIALIWQLTFSMHIKGSNPRSNIIIDLVLRAISDSRKGLMDLATKVFSESQLASFGITPGSLVDSSAASMFAKLQQLRIEIPPRFYPGTRRTIYHNDWMTTDVADKLWHLGFHETDETDHKGVTPLLMSTNGFGRPSGYPHDGLQWYISRGARLVFPKLKNLTLVHALALRFTSNGFNIRPRGESEREERKQIVRCLQPVLENCFKHLGTHLEDLCTCSCSVNGCTMIHFLLKGRGCESWWAMQEAVDGWMKCLPNDKSGLEAPVNDPDAANNGSSVPVRCYADLCRIELFRRLDMRHTCCGKWPSAFGNYPPENGVSYEFQPEDPMARGHHVNHHLTIAEEEKPDNTSEPAKTEILNRLMGLYGEFSCAHQGNMEFKQFWNIWWDVIEEFAPPKRFVNRYGGLVRIRGGSKLTLENLDETLGLIKKSIAKSIAHESAAELMMERGEFRKGGDT
ncbi:hypothetical protein NUW58_g875 [Xylaria curta]|uniref:Uncharacterized protein n=1 Tax=Xylaria curta TaxID=42375 RepID=A0ACC1PMR3_9PEZI|nr:hypothetical protein NUW58_g875 [Xylaria curta]